MEKIMRYSVLRYSPSKIAGERINLGIICDSETEDYKEFRYIKKFSRLSSFDDEVDIDVVKELLKTIQEDVEGTLMTGPFDLDSYIQFYINDFYFEEPKRITYDKVDEVVDTLYKTYLRFDLEVKERPSIADDKKMISRVLNDAGKTLRKGKWIGQFDEKVAYDFVTDEYCIKLFDFDKKDLNRIMNSAKTWAWNAEHTSERTPIMIYRYSDDVDSKREFDTIVNILKSSGAKVLSIDSGIKLLQQ